MDAADVIFRFDMDEVVELSNEIVQFMEDESVPMSLGAASAALSLGRLVSSKRLSFDEGATFISAMMDFATTYFHEGSVN